jgi:two-component system OmpR family response regulator
MTKPMIYICEDDPSLGEVVMDRLKLEGYQCRLFSDALEMDEQAKIQVPDLLLLDIQLPGESGYSIAQRYLRAMPSLRVIIMSVLNKQHDVLTGYNSGAMLYLAKPFKPEALVACLKGVFGNIADEAPEKPQALCLTVESQTLSCHGISVQLAESEVKMLVFLALRYPEVVEYHELMEHLGLNLEGSRKNTLETFISRLRHKLIPFEREHLTIKNVRNEGYRLSSGLIVHKERYNTAND